MKLLFKHIKEHFPDQECKLIVAVQDSAFILKYKPGTKMVYSTEERMFMVSAIRWVDEVVTYEDVDIQKIDFDVLPKAPTRSMPGSNELWLGVRPMANRW